MKKFFRTMLFTALAVFIVNLASAQSPHVEASNTSSNPIYVKLAGLGQNLTSVAIYLSLHIEGDVSCQTPSGNEIRHFSGPIESVIKTATQRSFKSGTASFYFSVPIDLDQEEFRGYKEGVCPPGEAIITNISNLTWSDIVAHVTAYTRRSGSQEYTFPL